MLRKQSLVWLASASLFAIASCGAQTPPTKDGAELAPLQVVALAYTGNSLTGETLSQLGVDLRSESAGAITLRLAPPIDSGAADGSSEAIRLVREGDVDLAVVAARTFDLEGATSMQALGVPLMVQSPEQAAAFLRDPVTDDMLSGLKGAGVVGLALTYDQMVQPLGFDGPINPAKLTGQRVLVRPSKVAAETVAALGATPDGRNGDDVGGAIAAHEVVGALSSLDRPSGQQSGAAGRVSAFTANVQLAIKANVIIVNADWWAGLSDEQRRALRDAATNTRDWSTSQTVPLAPAARAFCDQHLGDVVIADDAELQQWKKAQDAVVAEVSAADPVTAAALERMRQSVDDLPVANPPQACKKVPADDLPTIRPAGDQTVLEGQWRLLVSGERLAAAGATEQDATNNNGPWTFTFTSDGRYTTQERGRGCPGTYVINGNRLAMLEDASVGTCDGHWEFTFRRSGERLKLTPTPEFLATWPPMAAFWEDSLVLIANSSQ